jgi:hypothetical protein
MPDQIPIMLLKLTGIVIRRFLIPWLGSIPLAERKALTE